MVFNLTFINHNHLRPQHPQPHHNIIPRNDHLQHNKRLILTMDNAKYLNEQQNNQRVR